MSLSRNPRRRIAWRHDEAYTEEPSMSFRSTGIYPLAQHLHGCIPEGLRRWIGETADPIESDRPANTLLMELATVSDAPRNGGGGRIPDRLGGILGVLELEEEYG
jgi:hypothetical protein